MSGHHAGMVILSRISIIFSSSLAHVSNDNGDDSDIMGLIRKGVSQISKNSHSNKNRFMNNNSTNGFKISNTINDSNESNGHTCTLYTDPCTELQSLVGYEMVLFPFGLALVFILVGALPTLLLKSRYRVFGVKSCIWVLIELWIHLLISFAWFISYGDKAQAYVWALHSSTYILTSWQPKKSVINHPGLQKMASVTGAVCVALFAWHIGPPVGLAAWNRRSDAQCGWKVHLTAVAGVEVVEWGLGALGWILTS